MNRDCIMINLEQRDCKGLIELYCAKEDKPCPFYKPETLYNRDGSKKMTNNKIVKAGKEKVNDKNNNIGRKLADVVSRFDNMELLLSELREMDNTGYDDIETIEDLIEYLKRELEYSGY